MCKFLLPVAFLLLLASIGYSQDREKLNLSIGIGHNESSNLGVRYQFNQMQFGLGFGTKFGQKRGNRPEIFTGEFFYHFAGTAELSIRRPWYLRNGLVLRKENTPNLRTLTWLYNLRLGREFNISRKIGVSLDGGILTRLRERTKKIRPNGWPDDSVEFPIEPSFGFNFYYRFF